MANSVVRTFMKDEAIYKHKIKNHFLLIWYWGQHKQSEYLTGKKIEHSVCYNIRYCFSNNQPNHLFLLLDNFNQIYGHCNP